MPEHEQGSEHGSAGTVGHVVQVIGPVLDVLFEEHHLPEIYNAIRIIGEGFDVPMPIDIIAEVQQHLGEGRVRAVAMKLTSRQPIEFNLTEQSHLLVALEHVRRYDGETMVEGLPKSTRRDLTHKLAFIPAGCAFSGWMKPLESLQATLFYIDPSLLMVDTGRGAATTSVV